MEETDFIKTMNLLETKEATDIYEFKIGKKKVLLTAVHTMNQHLKDKVKLVEPYTKAICQYVANSTNAFYFVKCIDTGIDANKLENDEFKEKLVKYIHDYNIDLVIDLHGASFKHDFDVEFGTLDNLTLKNSTENDLRRAFKKVGISKISCNEPFKGGGITSMVYNNTDAEVVQIEINAKLRNIYEPEGLKRVTDALITFIHNY